MASKAGIIQRGKNKQQKAEDDQSHETENKAVQKEFKLNTGLLVLLTIICTTSFCLVVGTLLFVKFSQSNVSLSFPIGGYRPNYDLDWLNKLESEMRVNLKQNKAKSKKAQMRMAWQTPIMTVNLASLGVDVPKFNSKLAAIVLHEYYKLQEQNPQLTKTSEIHGSNQAFYDWQMQGGWNAFASQVEIQELMDIFQSMTDLFLQTVGQSEEFIQKRSRQIVCWATVHDNCISHPPHTHPNEIVSGVYYVKVPNDAGPIAFDDPRGPLPPFDNRIKIEPIEGDLILFPSWLLHQVMPTRGTEERISIPFNIHGDWESTSGISVTFPVDVPKIKKASQ